MTSHRLVTNPRTKSAACSCRLIGFYGCRDASAVLAAHQEHIEREKAKPTSPYEIYKAHRRTTGWH